jgi:hypothetical protein
MEQSEVNPFHLVHTALEVGGVQTASSRRTVLQQYYIL